MTPETTSDPKTYRELSVPFASQEAAEAAMRAFYADLKELRKRHRIADVYAVVQVPIADADGALAVRCSIHLGNERNAEPMLFHAIRELQAERKAEIDKLLAGG